LSFSEDSAAIPNLRVKVDFRYSPSDDEWITPVLPFTNDAIYRENCDSCCGGGIIFTVFANMSYREVDDHYDVISNARIGSCDFINTSTRGTFQIFREEIGFLVGFSSMNSVFNVDLGLTVNAIQCKGKDMWREVA